jgi:hypothetical protein
MREPDRGDAEMILKLYDLRRESEMRKARSFIMGYEVKTIDDVKAIVNWNHPENAHFRQVTSYWGMVADFATRGLLHPEPLLPQIRAEINPMFMKNIETAINSHPAIAERAGQVREMRKKMAAMPKPAAPKSTAKKPAPKKRK